VERREGRDEIREGRGGREGKRREEGRKGSEGERA